MLTRNSILKLSLNSTGRQHDTAGLAGGCVDPGFGAVLSQGVEGEVKILLILIAIITRLLRGGREYPTRRQRRGDPFEYTEGEP